MDVYNRVYDNLVERRERLLTGKINCIPFGLPRFEEELPGIEQGKYYIFTASSKIGKTQITDFCALYQPLMYAFNHRDQIKLKIFYFSLEMSIAEKYSQFMCHLLYKLSRGRIRIAPKDLKSTHKDSPLNEEILKILKSEEYLEYFKFFEETVTIIESIRNPYGIYKIMREHALKNDIQHKKNITIVDNKTKEESIHEVDDYYKPNNPEEYVLCIVDHASLLSPESGQSVKQAVDKLSSEYFILLRNKYNYIPILVQQQSAAQEGIENYKLNKLKPSLDGLAETKLTARDANYVIGLFSPYRYEIPSYLGYDITYYKDQIRFMEIIASRSGGGGTTVPLFFDGAVNYFNEMALPKEVEQLEISKRLVERTRNNKIMLLLHKIKKR